MKTLIFTEGTILMHPSARYVSRNERVKQSHEKSDTVKNFRNYIPIENAVLKLQNWKNQGGEVFYLTSRTTPQEVGDIRFVLAAYNFPNSGNVLFRKEGQKYADIVEKLMPDIFIEDDCESIGGEKETIYPNLKPHVKEKIKSVITKEFEGIDTMPDTLDSLTSTT